MSCLNEEQVGKISELVREIEKLSDAEKLLLYLQLPCGRVEQTDGKYIKLNGKHNWDIFSKKPDQETTQTYTWILSHLEEDPNVSLPKQEVYDEYRAFCLGNRFEPLCVADFGKAMKHAFPCIKARRLGQRGNSRYCYSGLRKKYKIEPPNLPDMTAMDISVSGSVCSDHSSHSHTAVNACNQQPQNNHNHHQHQQQLRISIDSHQVQPPTTNECSPATSTSGRSASQFNSNFESAMNLKMEPAGGQHHHHHHPRRHHQHQHHHHHHHQQQHQQQQQQQQQVSMMIGGEQPGEPYHGATLHLLAVQKQAGASSDTEMAPVHQQHHHHSGSGASNNHADNQIPDRICIQQQGYGPTPQPTSTALAATSTHHQHHNHRHEQQQQQPPTQQHHLLMQPQAEQPQQIVQHYPDMIQRFGTPDDDDYRHNYHDLNRMMVLGQAASLPVQPQAVQQQNNSHNHPHHIPNQQQHHHQHHQHHDQPQQHQPHSQQPHAAGYLYQPPNATHHNQVSPQPTQMMQQSSHHIHQNQHRVVVMQPPSRLDLQSASAKGPAGSGQGLPSPPTENVSEPGEQTSGAQNEPDSPTAKQQAPSLCGHQLQEHHQLFEPHNSSMNNTNDNNNHHHQHHHQQHHHQHMQHQVNEQVPTTAAPTTGPPVAATSGHQPQQQFPTVTTVVQNPIFSYNMNRSTGIDCCASPFQSPASTPYPMMSWAPDVQDYYAGDCVRYAD